MTSSIDAGQLTNDAPPAHTDPAFGTLPDEVRFDPKHGRKDDLGKIRYDLLPPDALKLIAGVLTYGANKYSARNWEKGMAWGRCYRALLGHLNDWHAGETYDPETEMPHLAHAACCIMFLMSYEARGIGDDDRPKLTKEGP